MNKRSKMRRSRVRRSRMSSSVRRSRMRSRLQAADSGVAVYRRNWLHWFL